LRQAVRDGWPWRLHESDRYCSVPLNAKLQIVLSHLSGVYTLPCGFPMDPHPADETLKIIRRELAADLKKSEKQWGHLVSRAKRWGSADLRFTNYGQPERQLY
jgi:hypothetical protein